MAVNMQKCLATQCNISKRAGCSDHNL